MMNTQNSVEQFFGPDVSREIPTMSDRTLRRAISEIRRIWIRTGDYVIGRDMTCSEIFAAAREYWPRLN